MAPARHRLAGSQIFQPYRALGFVTNHVPFVLQSKGTEHFVTTCIGSSYHQYNCGKLNLLFVGPQMSQPITCMAAHGDMVFTANGNDIYAWTRGKQVHAYIGHTAPVHTMLCFGGHLLAVDDANVLRIWGIEDQEQYGEVEFDAQRFLVTSLMHPSTYMNKVLLGSKQGELQLWNIRTSKLVYSVKGWGSAVTCIVQAPAVDTVGIGLEDGRTIIHNLKFDEKVMTLRQEWGAVTTLSFRTDEHAVLATGAGGRVVLWDLAAQKQLCVVTDAHQGSIAHLQFMQGQSTLVTAGADNCLKIWVFDQPDGMPRLLRSRSGHGAPPVHLRFYGPSGHELLSAGLDRAVRAFSMIRDAQNVELSQGSVARSAKKLGMRIDELRLPPVIAMAAEELRARDWDNVVTCHLHELEARTWRWADKALGRHVLKPPGAVPAGTEAKCVAVSACGHYAFIGYSDGAVHQYALQSGRHVAQIHGKPVHAGAVRSIATDALNTLVLTGGKDGLLKFWEFRTRRRVATVDTGSGIARLVLHRESGMVCAVGDDWTLRMYDCETRRLVRAFPGHSNVITDVAFNPDGRWLISAAMDSTVRVWDVVAGRLLDWFRVPAPVTSLAFSPNAQFLVTTHVDSLGLYTWANKTVFSVVALRPVDPAAGLAELALPTTAGEVGESDVSSDDMDEDGTGDSGAESDASNESAAFKSADQLAEELLTLSSMPAAFWQNLANLDLIKERNRPTEAPAAPEKAPFFLPTLPGLVPAFVAADSDEALPKAAEGKSRLISLGSLNALSPFAKALTNADASHNYAGLVDLLKGMSPAAVDVELRSLSPSANGGEQLVFFMRFLANELAQRRNFEVVESLLAAFLRIHADSIAENPALVGALAEVRANHEAAWQRLSNLLHHTLCLTAFMKSDTV